MNKPSQIGRQILFKTHHRPIYFLAHIVESLRWRSFPHDVNDPSQKQTYAGRQKPLADGFDDTLYHVGTAKRDNELPGPDGYGNADDPSAPAPEPTSDHKCRPLLRQLFHPPLLPADGRGVK